MEAKRIEILLVDDDGAHIEMMTRAFESRQERVRVWAARSLSDAHELLASSTPDLVIADLRLSDGDGTDLIPKERDAGPFPVIILTGQGDQRAAVEAMQRGALEYVVKTPAAFADLPHIAQRALSRWDLIQERNRGRQQLRESEELYRSLVDTLPQCIIRKDINGYITFASQPFCEMVERSVDQVVGLTDVDLFPARLAAKYRREDQHVMSTREIMETVEEHQQRDKETRFVQVLRIPIFNTADQVVGVQAIFWDITERRLAERLLEMRERQQAAVAKLGLSAILGGDLAGLMDEVVRTIAQTLDVEYCKVIEFLPGQQMFRLRAGVGWADGLVGTATIDAGLNSQAGYTLASNEPVIVADLNHESRFNGPALLHQHNIVSGVSVVIRGLDVPFGVLGAHSARRRAFTRDDAHFLEAVANLLAEAIQRKRAERTIRESEMLLSGVINNSPAVIYVKDVQGRYMLINSLFERLFHLKNAEVVGKTDFDLFPKETAQTFRANDLQVLSAKAPMEWEEVVPQDDGDHIYLSAKFPLLTATGTVDAVCGISTDITHWKQMDKVLRRAERLASTGTLAAGIAHEINNPMAAAWAAAESALALKDKPEAGDLFDESLHAVVKSIRRCDQIIQNVLRFSRNQPSDMWPEDINEIVRRGCEMASAYSARHNARLTLQLADDLPHPTVNAVEIEQVFVNLLRNAIEASTGEPEITVSTAATGDTVSFAVQDRGCGLTGAEQARIFDPFYTARREGNGVGLGLSIAYRIIQEHGGSIEVSGQVGEGTTMTVNLPITGCVNAQDWVV